VPRWAKFRHSCNLFRKHFFENDLHLHTLKTKKNL
jgi:hypothetical protein